MPDRPNILLITSDQQRWHAVGKTDPLARTPHLDALADEGICFTNAYCPNPTCTPARCSIITGQMPSKHGAYAIGCSLDENYPTFPEHFNRAGYQTTLVGKAHFQQAGAPGSFESKPHITNSDFFKNWSGPYYGFDRARLVIGHANAPVCPNMHYGLWLREQGVDVEKYFAAGDAGTPMWGVHGKWDLPEKYHYGRWTALEAISEINRAIEQNKPFLVWSSFQDPHHPYVCPEPWCNLVQPEDITHPPVRSPEEGEGKPHFYKSIKDERASEFEFFADPDLARNPSNFPHSMYKLFDGDELKQVHAMYYNMIALMDHHIGLIVEHLKERNLYDSTIIVFASDHGDYLGHEGLWFKGIHAYDEAQKVPFIVRHPECLAPGTVSDTLQNLVDLAPSFLEAAGIPEPRCYDGISQLPVWRGEKESVRDWTMVECRPGDVDFLQKTFVTPDFKLVVYQNRTYGELYDRASDPGQRQNLWDSPEHQPTKLRLLQRLASAEMEKERVRGPRPSGA